MRGWMACPALVLVLMTIPLLAQRHGGSGGFTALSGPASHSSFAGHSSASHFSNMSHGPITSHGQSFARGARFNGNFRAGHRRSSFSGSRRNGGFKRRRFFYGGSPWLSYGYGGYYSYPNYDDYNYLSADSYPAGQYSDSASYDDFSMERQQDKIDRLEGEVAELREQQNSSRPPSAVRAGIRVPTVLVFNDHHTQEVENYAVVGDTLWVFDVEKATKISVGSLDIPATTKANDDRGVDFRLPEQQ